MKREWKADDTPVTVTDIRINKLVISGVKKHFPQHGVLGEEESYNTKDKEYLWVVDPVDGTVPFSHGIPTFVFSLALVKNGMPILGVIYDPLMDRMYVGEKGRGAFLNGKRIRVNTSGLKNSVAFTPTKNASRYRDKYPKVFWLNLFSICYEGAMVASGHAIAALYDYTFPHDVAALKAIVEEAGGKVTDLKGKEQRYDRPINGAFISNGKVHKELLKIVIKKIV